MYQGSGNFKCIDAGTGACPCKLAETGDCIVCSRLNGADCCDCNWQGVCVYNEYVQNGRKTQGRRKERVCKIVDRSTYSENFDVFVADTGRGFATSAARPGSYVFMRPEGSDRIYDAPISVLKSEPDKGMVHFGIKRAGVKTGKLFENSEGVVIRGVYGNGLQGLDLIRDLKRNRLPQRKVMILARGAAVTAAINTVLWLGEGLKIKMIIDCRDVGETFIYEYLPEYMAGNYIYLDFQNEWEKVSSKAQIFSPDVLIANTSDYYIEKTAGLIDNIRGECGFAYANNMNICCGEGICGGCCCTDSEGNSHKMCKCQERQAAQMATEK